MKNLKKSLLVVPALGVLMLAAAGSVGGTVAWFSSVNSFSTKVSDFAVGRVQGNLNVRLTADPIRGTVQSGDNVVVGHVAAGDARLTHGSFKHDAPDVLANSSVYTISNQTISIGGSKHYAGTISIDRAKFLSASKQKAGTYHFVFTSTPAPGAWAISNAVTVASVSAENMSAEWGLTLSANPENADYFDIVLENSYANSSVDTPTQKWMYSGSKVGTPTSYYWFYAVHWTMTFSYEFGADTSNRYVYFDKAASSILATAIDENDNETLKTKDGFRIAFHAGTRTVIWAPEHTADNKADCHYVTSASAIANYADSDTESLIYSDIPAAQIVASNAQSGGTATGSANKNYLCTLRPDDGNAENGTENVVAVECVAWFEGSDPAVVNAAEMQSVAATMGFFALAA